MFNEFDLSQRSSYKSMELLDISFLYESIKIKQIENPRSKEIGTFIKTIKMRENICIHDYQQHKLKIKLISEKYLAHMEEKPLIE